MKTKAEILMSINEIKAKAGNASFLSKTQATDSVKKLLKTSKTAEESFIVSVLFKMVEKNLVIVI